MQDSKTSNIYILHRALAVLLDILVVVLFVLIGQQSHGTYTPENKYRIVLSFISIFFAIQLIHGKDLLNIKYAAISGAIAVPIAIFLRVTLDDRVFDLAFLIVTFLFLNAGWILWRFALNKLRPNK